MESSPWSEAFALAAPSAKTGLDDWSEQKNKVDADKEEQEQQEDGAEMDSPMRAFLRPNLWDEVKRGYA